MRRGLFHEDSVSLYKRAGSMHHQTDVLGIAGIY